MPKITFLESPKKGFTKNKVKPFLSDPRKVNFGIVFKEISVFLVQFFLGDSRKVNIGVGVKGTLLEIQKSISSSRKVILVTEKYFWSPARNTFL